MVCTQSLVCSHEPCPRWRTPRYRKRILRDIEHAIMYCPHSLEMNAGDIECLAYRESRNKRQYLRTVQKAIDAIDKMTMPNMFERQPEACRTMPEDNPRDDEEPGTSAIPVVEGPPSTVSTRACKRKQSIKERVRKSTNHYKRLQKSRQLKLKSQKYLRQTQQNPQLHNYMAVRRKKCVMARLKMQQYLTTLICKERDRIIENINKQEIEDKETKKQSVRAMATTWMSRVCSFFAELDELDQVPTIPTYICDPITNNILMDPVVATSGITYERSVIEDYMKTALFDPITHSRFTSHVLIPNYTLKDIVNDFVNENEWVVQNA